jgi:hypothetical protein
VEELTEELEQKEDQIVNLKDDIAELQIEIEELKEAQTASAAAAAAAPAPAQIDLSELLAGIKAKLDRYHSADATNTDGWNAIELEVKRLIDHQHIEHESEVDAMEKEWNKIEDEGVERERALELKVDQLEKQVARLEREQGSSTDHERSRSFRGRRAGGDEEDDNGPTDSRRYTCMCRVPPLCRIRRVSCWRVVDRVSVISQITSGRGMATEGEDAREGARVGAGRAQDHKPRPHHLRGGETEPHPRSAVRQRNSRRPTCVVCRVLCANAS